MQRERDDDLCCRRSLFDLFFAENSDRQLDRSQRLREEFAQLTVRMVIARGMVRLWRTRLMMRMSSVSVMMVMVSVVSDAGHTAGLNIVCRRLQANVAML